MVMRVWLVAGFLVVVVAWALMVPWSPPAEQAVPGSMIEGYRSSGLMPAAGALRISEEIGHDVFELPATDARHLKQAAPEPKPAAEAGHGGGEQAGRGGGEQAGLSVLAEGTPDEIKKALGATAVDRTIEISMSEWGYQPGHVTVKPGEVIRLVLRHAGYTPHEFMLMTDAAMNAVDYRLQRADWSLLEHEAIYEKSLVLPGDRFEVVVKVNQPGAWMYMCMLPYHMQLGMMGMLMTPGVSMAGMAHGRTPAPASGPFEGRGTVIAVVPESRELVLDHGEIKGLMGAMTMGYPVASEALLKGLNPGDTVKFRIDPAGQKIIAVERLGK
ncbi:MAG: copper-binding protein [Betaproteobacteria bacterium]|nr:copper-binding protein [Betaproteobacteria bacterium]